MMRTLLIVILSLAAHLARADASEAVSNRLDSFHDAAATADFERYFGVFADDGVFLGTDRSERWTVDTFKAYAKPSFDAGRGWTYLMTERHIMLSADKRLAWFDEVLMNERLGPCRGTGVFRLSGDSWELVHYSLSMLVPNEIAYTVGAQSLAAEKDVGEATP